MAVGALRIITTPHVPAAESDTRIQHLIDLLVLADQYRWDWLRALYQEVLSMISQGWKLWENSIKDLKDEMLRPWDQLNNNVPQKDKNTTATGVCRNWNFGRDGCTRGTTCYHKLICMECNRAQVTDATHRASACPRRASAVTPQSPSQLDFPEPEEKRANFTSNQNMM